MPNIIVGNALQVLENAAAEGTAVVRRLQSFARQSDTPTLVPVDLAALVRDVVEITRPRWRGEPRRAGRVITVEMSLPAGLPRIVGNAAELRDALTQLIFNAVDAMPTGGVLRIAGRLVDSSTSRVGVGTASSSESTHPLLNQPASWVELIVTDTGLGMTEDIRRKVFDPYFTTKGAHGAGLGLSLVYGVVERHGGQIEVASEPGQGTTFTLRLRSADAEPQGLPSGAIGKTTRGCRVLLIDDDPMVRETLAALLRATNHVVIEAEDGPGGLACLDKTPVDVVLTDFGMPGLTGWQVALAVKAKRPTVPVVLLTGWGEPAGEGDENATAVDRVLKKPIRLYDLLQVLAELLLPPNPA
jgi:CheY-like chemotaxis protein